MMELGAQLNGNWIKSPEELVAALETDSGRVEFWPTDSNSRGMGQHFPASQINRENWGSGFVVVGPNPWINRRWRRQLELVYHWRGNNGDWKVKVAK